MHVVMLEHGAKLISIFLGIFCNVLINLNLKMSNQDIWSVYVKKEYESIIAKTNAKKSKDTS